MYETPAATPQPSQGRRPVVFEPGKSKSKNIRVKGRRTSVRLEESMWRALHEVAENKKCTIHDLCNAIEDTKHPGASFSAALRVFLMEHYRTRARMNE